MDTYFDLRFNEASPGEKLGGNRGQKYMSKHQI